MQNQSLQIGTATPTVRLFFYTTADGTPATVLYNAAGLSLAYARDNAANSALTLVTATLGTWVSQGFISRGGGVHDLYLPTTANNTGAKSLTIIASGLPTGVSMIPCVVPMFVDDVTAAAPTEATVATATVAAMRTEETLSAWGVSSQPVGGSTKSYPEFRNAVLIGTRTAYFDANNVCVGMTAVV